MGNSLRQHPWLPNKLPRNLCTSVCSQQSLKCYIMQNQCYERKGNDTRANLYQSSILIILVIGHTSVHVFLIKFKSTKNITSELSKTQDLPLFEHYIGFEPLYPSLLCS